MLIPVFTVFAAELTDATPVLIGFALGSYGLSQALLQIPFGLLSDRFGRKPLLTIGLLLFAMGSLIGALSHSIYLVIFARILQGTGAIGSVLIALLADLTPDEQRTKAMAIIGITIGLSFSLAMILSPLLTAYFGLAGIFYLTTALALAGLFLLHMVIPNPPQTYFPIDRQTKRALVKNVLANRHLQRLNLGIFFQHWLLTSTFYVIPLLLTQRLGPGKLSQQWQFYLPLMVFSFICMLPFIRIAEKKKGMKIIFLTAISCTAVAQCSLFFFQQHWFLFCGFLFLYFIAFNFLEASLPSLVSKQAPLHSKGTAMGIYSSSQFMGIFVGGSLAGILYQYAGSSGIFFTNTILCFIWLFIASSMQPQCYFSTYLLPYPTGFSEEENLIKRLKNLTGVQELKINKNENLIYLLVDKATFKEQDAKLLLEKISTLT